VHRCWQGDAVTSAIPEPVTALALGLDGDVVTLPDVDRVTVAPGWKAGTAIWSDELTTLSVDLPPWAPDAYHPSDTLFPGGIYDLEIDPEAATDPHRLAVEIVTLIGLTAVHEALEWVRVDGLRLADPHPDDDGPSWDTIRDAVRIGVLAHIAKFPTPETT
jgi:hypothetical protein